MLHHTCTRCGGTGRDSYEPAAPVCWGCAGKGLTLHPPTPKGDGLGYLTAQERAQLEADNAAFRAAEIEKREFFQQLHERYA